MSRKDIKIQELVSKLESLAIETSKLTKELKDLTSDPNEIEVGDTIRVLNRLNYQLGVRGTVTKVTKTRVYFKVTGDSTSTEHYRAYHNVEKVLTVN